MARTDFSSLDCSVARGITEVGDIWSFLIIREAMFGTRQYSKFLEHLGIARNVLTDRLNALVEHELLEKVDVGELGPRYEYQLTQKGEELLPIVVAIRQWADKWVEPEKRQIVKLSDREDGKPLKKIMVQNHKGRALKLDEIGVSFPGKSR